MIDFSLMPKFLSDKQYIRIQHADGTHSVKLLNSLKLRSYEKQKKNMESMESMEANIATSIRQNSD